MPPLVILAIVGAGCFAGYKLFNRMLDSAEAARRAKAERARAPRGTARDLGALEWDAEAKVYRPGKGAQH